MTQEGVKLAIRNGNKVIHNSFINGEYVMKDSEEGVLVFEDGVRQVEREFWLLRTSAKWRDGWEILEEPKEQLISDIKMSKIEDAVITVSEALGMTEKDVVNMLEIGLQIHQSNKILEPRSAYLIEELRSTFNAY